MVAELTVVVVTALVALMVHPLAEDTHVVVQQEHVTVLVVPVLDNPGAIDQLPAGSTTPAVTCRKPQ